MKTALLTNPFYCYIVSFGIALFIYSWGWSELYPKLTFEVVFFLFFSFIVAFCMGRLIRRKLVYKIVFTDKKNTKIVSLILLGYLLEFIYNGGVPLFMLIRGTDIDYMTFGIPTFHVLLHTFTSFYAVYMFHQYMSYKSIKSLLYVIILLSPFILTVNRGALILAVVACVVVYFFAIGKLLFSRIVVLLISFCLFFYGFGYLGNMRSFNSDSVALLKFTNASQSFLDSSIPAEYYWFYLYASSPLANFQNATITSKKHRNNLAAFITWEMVPDFISKRIIPSDYDGGNRINYSVHPTLTVGSIYFGPFVRLGWYGPFFIFIYYVTIFYLYIISLPTNSRYFVSAIAIVCVISVFNIFENMINFSGLIVQLIFPFVLSKIDEYKIRLIGFRFLLFNKRIRFRL